MTLQKKIILALGIITFTNNTLPIYSTGPAKPHVEIQFKDKIYNWYKFNNDLFVQVNEDLHIFSKSNRTKFLTLNRFKPNTITVYKKHPDKAQERFVYTIKMISPDNTFEIHKKKLIKEYFIAKDFKFPDIKTKVKGKLTPEHQLLKNGNWVTVNK